MKPSTRLIGYWSAVASTAFDLAYVVALLATLTGAIPPRPLGHRVPARPFDRAGLELQGAHGVRPRRGPSQQTALKIVAFGFALLLCMMNCIVCFTELAVVIPRITKDSRYPSCWSNRESSRLP